MIVELYRKKIPENIRDIIYKMFLGSVLRIYRDPKVLYKKIMYSIRKPHSDLDKAWMIWSNSLIESPYPYDWVKEYEYLKINVFEDRDGVPYVYHNKLALYFKKEWNTFAPEAYRGLLIEQDPRSAHCYLADMEFLRGKTVLDIGAAEGIFTLNVIAYVDHAYLFECDEKWIEALSKTFDSWKDKITIVRKYVSDVDDDNNITLDTFFKDKPVKNLFLKMDIEGYEKKALRGAERLLQSSLISGAVCIYHMHDDKADIESYLQSFGKKTEIQPGYLYYEKEMRSAVLRFY